MVKESRRKVALEAYKLRKKRYKNGLHNKTAADSDRPKQFQSASGKGFNDITPWVPANVLTNSV